jgi:mono/diheme cytochrome c family protein
MKLKTIIILLSWLGISGLLYAETTSKIPKISGLAIHHGDVTQYVAATQSGLYTSLDNGQTWTFSGQQRLPATMVSEVAAGTLYAFVVGQGLLLLDNKTNQWQVVNNQFGAQVLVELTAETGNPNKLIGLNQFGKLIVSENSGKDWHRINGPYKISTETEARGQALYQQFCQSCHGVDGVGETYTSQALTDKNYIRAPAMNVSEHAWHHTDEALQKTILEGSPRTERMMPWKKAGLNEANAQDLIAYIKSLWTQRELDCQGPKHMSCPQ